MKRLIYLLLNLIIFGQAMIAQDRLGISSGNYAGVHGVFINPSSISNSKKYLDITLPGGSFFFDNNFIYIPKEDNLFDQKMNFARGALKFKFPGFYDDDYIFSDRYDAGPKAGYSELRLTGPAAMYSANGHAFAIQLSNRFIVSGHNVPYDIAKLAYEQRHYPQLHRIKFSHDAVFNIGSASWTELGFTFAKSYDYNRNTKIAAGVSVKRLWSYHGVHLHSKKLDYLFINSDSLEIHRFDGQLSFALPFSFDNNQFLGMEELVQGRGFGFDAGITIIRKQNNGSQNSRLLRHVYASYKYRVGISFFDIGRLNYSRNAKVLMFDGTAMRWPGLDTLNPGSISNLTNEIFAVPGNQSNTMKQRNSFSLWLPATLSLQFDYSLGYDLFINAIWMQSLVLSKNQLERPSYVSLVPRYEKNIFEVALPLTLFLYREPRIGFALKAGFISIGTDRLGALFGTQDLEGVDFYFSVNAGLCKKQYEKEHKRYAGCHSFF